MAEPPTPLPTSQSIRLDSFQPFTLHFFQRRE
jgi:hypothetical protein